MGSKLKRALIVVAGLAALALGGAAIATTGTALDRASAAALKHTGGGKVTETEAGDEEGAYEVEVTRSDGSQVDVHLDKNFKVLNADSDNGEGDGAEDN
jgi:uncharacterized membrane protein YkoI